MAIKMRVLYNSTKPKIKNIANEIKAHYDLGVNAVDVIPPAYSCDKERIVILALTAKGAHLDDSLRLFCQELTKVRAQNIALMIDGNEAAANAVKKVLAEVAQNNAVLGYVVFDVSNIIADRLISKPKPNCNQTLTEQEPNKI